MPKKLSNKKNRTKLINLRFTKQEKENLENYAKSHGYEYSTDLIRELLADALTFSVEKKVLDI